MRNMVRVVIRYVSVTIIIVWCLQSVAFGLVEKFSYPTNHRAFARFKIECNHPTISFARPYRPIAELGDGPNVPDDMEPLTKRQQLTDRPTLTQESRIEPPTIPDRPKIVVLGASGKIGRLVVRQLLEKSNLDATIVAFVKDYDKACRVLFDDLLVLSNRRNRDRSINRGPQLQIVEGNLVPPDDLPGYIDEEEALWLQRAKSAAAFYGSTIQEYDNRRESSEDAPIDPNEVLLEAIRGCTTIISCVGSVRPTHLWSDILARPLWRLLRRNVSAWCKDARHPYYVHFASTRKALKYAEREQLRREAAAQLEGQESRSKQQNHRVGQRPNHDQVVVPRIRFIRISDLCVAQQPWHFVPLITNIMHSMVFRYQQMAENVLQASSVVESIVIRPGDLTDEERDMNTTSLQVDPGGFVPSPSRVGRDDVAALAVAAALFDDCQQHERSYSASNLNDIALESPTSKTLPLHLTLAVRWVGADMAPYPAQGCKDDGLPSANLCLESALRKIRGEEGKKGEKQKGQNRPVRQDVGKDWNLHTTRSRKLKPYGICAAIPIYLVLALVAKSIWLGLVQLFPVHIVATAAGTGVGMLAGPSRAPTRYSAKLSHWINLVACWLLSLWKKFPRPRGTPSNFVSF